LPENREVLAFVSLVQAPLPMPAVRAKLPACAGAGKQRCEESDFPA
jgi:hypothetical protein